MNSYVIRIYKLPVIEVSVMRRHTLDYNKYSFNNLFQILLRSYSTTLYIIMIDFASHFNKKFLSCGNIYN